MKSILFTLSVLFVLPAFSMQLGDLVIGGNGCFGSSKLIPVSNSDGRYALPIRAKINKKAGAAFERKTCNLRLPVSLNPNEKLQLINLSQVVRLVAYKGAEVKTSLSMGIVGSSSTPLNFDIKVTDEDSSVIENLKADGVIAESACGKNAMITGNLSLLVNGSSAQAFVSTGTALVTLKVVNCNQ
ncbi:MAG: hypothetical protein K0R29_638 [Pseudobdellovibrio sp.]|jgi:hypothetical protein|nr:hypothetical protein [Pseudobdellovibrio sp.]